MAFVYFEDAVVSRSSNLYRVDLKEEEVTVFLREPLVYQIGEKTETDENLIAIVLAYIEYVRNSWAESMRRRVKRFDDELVTEGLCIILKTISIDELIIKIKSMKWHEINLIFNADSPVEEFKKI